MSGSRRARRLALGCVLAAVAAACGPAVRVTQLSGRGDRPNVCAAGVRVITDRDSVPAASEEVAQLSVTAPATEAVDAMRRSAGKLGANALYVRQGAVEQRPTGPTGVSPTVGRAGGGGAEMPPVERRDATALYIPADSARVRRACGR